MIPSSYQEHTRSTEETFALKEQSVMNSAGIMLGSFTEKIGQVLLRIVPQTAQVRVLSGPLRGKKWIAGASTNSCWLGVYEMQKQNVFRSLIRPGDVVYDLGANVDFILYWPASW
jgi:hypothetical protein